MPKRMPEYSVWKPAVKLRLRLGQVERRALRGGEAGRT